MRFRFDYRTKYKEMTKEQLENALVHLQAKYDKKFIYSFDNEAISKAYREMKYVENKLAKMRTK